MSIFITPVVLFDINNGDAIVDTIAPAATLTRNAAIGGSNKIRGIFQSITANALTVELIFGQRSGTIFTFSHELPIIAVAALDTEAMIADVVGRYIQMIITNTGGTSATPRVYLQGTQN